MMNLNLLLAVSLSSLNLLASAQAPIQPDTNMPEGYQPGMATVCSFRSILIFHAAVKSMLIPCSSPTARPRARRPAKHLHDQLQPSRQPIYQHLGAESSTAGSFRRGHQRCAWRRSRRLRAMWELLQHHLDRQTILRSKPSRS